MYLLKMKMSTKYCEYFHFKKHEFHSRPSRFMLDNDGLVLFCYLNQNNKFSDSGWIGITDKSAPKLNKLYQTWLFSFLSRNKIKTLFKNYPLLFHI